MARADQAPAAGYARNQYDHGPVQLSVSGELAPLHHHVGDYNIELSSGGLTTRPHPPDCIGESAMTNFEPKMVACRFSRLSSPPPPATTTSSSTVALVHHGILFVSKSYTFGLGMFNMDDITGESR